jgi:uncharacterized membrane protein YkoI
MKRLLQTGLFLSLLMAANIYADEDQEQARELVRSGEIIPLEQLLQQVQSKQPDKLRLLEAELERKHGRLLYELEFVDQQGRVRKLLFDAKTAEPVEAKGN